MSAIRDTVSILVPARDEAANVGQCLAALRRLETSGELEILVLDDRSSDHTAQVIAHHLVDPRVHVIQGIDEPPPGWLGKPWACYRLSQQATGRILVFVDADVRLEPHALNSSMALLGDQDGLHVDAVSPYPRQIAVTLSERLVQPLLQWSWLSFLPLRLAETSSRESLTAANGQFLVISRDAYDTIGGHSAVRGNAIEDVGIFRALKRHGQRGVMADGTTLATCRMYNGWPEVRDGYAKSLWSAFGSKAGATAAAAMLATLYLVPPAAMAKGSRVGAIGYLAAVTGRIAVARRVNGRVVPDAFAHPLSIAVLQYLTALSWYRRSRGTLSWKGRSLSAANPHDAH